MALRTALLAGFAAAALAPWIHALTRRWSGSILAALPFTLLLFFASVLPGVTRGEPVVERHAWAPELALTLSFRLDALALVFALLITGIGGLVTLYASRYLEGHRQLGRFYLLFFVFMSSMLGLVLADNLIALFVFWELTSLSSYLLIGFDHARATSRHAALQGLLVTVGGGQALLVGLLLLGSIAGTFEISELTQIAGLRQHPLYAPIVILVLAGAFTKSAQFPFHFWLPGAMAAPTPVSAYLHSATMVKAGVYLIARLSPALGGTSLWQVSVTVVGGATMLLGAYLALGEHDLKRVLAYATVSVLGLLTFLLGLGTPAATHAALVFLVGHALYKGALFLVAGAVDHAAGTRDVDRLGGLRRLMPVTAAAAALAALSMAGLSPAFGFIGKELVYESALAVPWRTLAMAVTVFTFIPLVAVAGIVSIRPFFGPAVTVEAAPGAHEPHEAPPAMWLGPLVLAGLGLVLGLRPALVEALLSRAAFAVAQSAEEPAPLALWHGLTPALALSGLSLAAGVLVYRARGKIRHLVRETSLARWGPERAYSSALARLNDVARAQTRLLQAGYLRRYVLMTLVAIGGLAAVALAARTRAWPTVVLASIRPHELVIAVLMVLAAAVAAISRSRLGTITAMGVVGFGVALQFLFFGAPDLALTQAIVEALTVVVFLFALLHLPRYHDLSSTRTRIRDLALALAFGGVMTVLVLLATQEELHPTISGYFLENSVAEAHGRNVVNVILVDFRALDTMGEITVLAVAGVGVWSLLKLRAGRSPG
jgi:multicomponent Na+:H+ antiporter subunit A